MNSIPDASGLHPTELSGQVKNALEQSKFVPGRVIEYLDYRPGRELLHDGRTNLGFNNIGIIHITSSRHQVLIYPKPSLTLPQMPSGSSRF